ncbi:MAG TPA: rhodanese-like domain-containing protein [Epsilonproteobacteria bacterium]|nr:rhodanese-like domain-containing protein [Campylobacterota bacterium]HHH37578.1 rhodanese-like domain-containing protein [Campylobacterota bacterium]
MKNNFLAARTLLSLIFFISSLSAVEVNIKKGLPFVDVDIGGKSVRIERIQDLNHKLKNAYTKTSRPAPPFSVQPFQPIEGIKTVSELDVIDFIAQDMNRSSGLLVDARMPKWYQVGTIPGAINIPFSILSTKGENPFIGKILGLLGANHESGKWDFSKAQNLLIFDNGPWCQQGVRAMKNLIRMGYPKSKIKYYRGGIQFWQILGLTTLKP